MAVYPKPDSDEWFAALRKFNPQQAAQTEQIIKLAGNDRVCSVCGDDPATDYRLVGDLPADAVGTLRLCDDCRRIRGVGYGEEYEPL